MWKEQYSKKGKVHEISYRVIFLTGPHLKMYLDWPPPKMPQLAPPTLKSMATKRGEIPNTLTFSIPMGGQSGTLNVFLKSVTYWPTLSKFRGGPVKKIPLHISNLIESS